MVRRIAEKVQNEDIRRDLERYSSLALELGATDAKIITADQIVVDERVRMKCLHPICQNYGTNIHCPPHVGDLDQTRRLLKAYGHALMIMLRVPSRDLIDPDYQEQKALGSMKINEIVSKIESEAFYDGHHLAIGFATGCKGLWCPDQCCSALAGDGCRFPLKARAGMDAVGIDAYTMATRVGWTIYPIGKNADIEETPHGTRLGLVLIS